MSDFSGRSHDLRDAGRTKVRIDAAVDQNADLGPFLIAWRGKEYSCRALLPGIEEPTLLITGERRTFIAQLLSLGLEVLCLEGIRTGRGDLRSLRHRFEIRDIELLTPGKPYA